MGKCPNVYKCLSTGACNVCGLISGTHEGCASTSTTPICDADSTTTIIDDTAVAKEAICKGCTKSGTNLVGHMKCEYWLAKTCHCVIDDILVILFLDGQTQGDGTSIGKCPNSLKCLSTGECRVCKIVNSVHEGCSGATPYCDESSNPSTCISKHIATFFIW